MPIIKSAKKRVRVTQKASVRNSKTKRTLKSTLKSFHAAIVGGDKKLANENHGKAQSAIDTAAKKGILHPNKAARKKRQLSAAAKAASSADNVAASKSAKTTAKKAAPVKKPTAKKAVASKKTAVKKTSAKK